MRPRDTTTAWQGEKIGAGGALRELFMFVLPKDNPEMLTRILVALGLIGLARVGTIVTPLAYGWLVDHVAGGDNTFDITVMWWLLGAYAVARVSRQIFDEGSEYAFARVAQRAVHVARGDKDAPIVLSDPGRPRAYGVEQLEFYLLTVLQKGPVWLALHQFPGLKRTPGNNASWAISEPHGE